MSLVKGLGRSSCSVCLACTYWLVVGEALGILNEWELSDFKSVWFWRPLDDLRFFMVLSVVGWL